ncbi:uncharacterized protein PG998_013238 [Apiospora kogelbergensis]|uniref:Uncharacterized protein n=1 Tax=Apiospora kogelbergensis TaxID=1337665 RepID=A0AAW0R1V4_9PEZI
MTNSTTPYNYTQGAADLQAITIDQAACYAQTFGGIGFASHMPTYYLPRWGRATELERIDVHGDKVEVKTRVSLPSGKKRIPVWPALLWILGSFAGVSGTIAISHPRCVAEGVDHRFGPLFILAIMVIIITLTLRGMVVIITMTTVIAKGTQID